MVDYIKRVSLIEDLLDKGEYATCIQESGKLIEEGLRYRLNNLFAELEDSNSRETILNAEKIHRKGNQTISTFGLGQLCGIMRDAKVWKLLRQQLTSNLQRTKSISWHQVVDWRNAATHSVKHITIGELEALQMYVWTKNFLIDCELIDKYKPVDCTGTRPQLLKCPICKESSKRQWKYCPFCGSGINLSCPACTRPVSDSWKRCPWCEGKLAKGDLETELLAKQEYKHLCRGVWLDGVVNKREREELEKRRIELGISYDVAQEIETKCVPHKNLLYTNSVEAVLIDNKITKQERSYLDKRAERLGIDKWLQKQIENALIATN